MSARVSTKADKRAAAKAYRRAAAAKARAARRRRQAVRIGGTALAVAAVIVGAFLLFGGSDEEGTPSTATSPTPTTSAESFPPLPEGADPALATKPTVTAGTGDLKQLKVTTLIQGTGPAVQTGQTITVNYVGVSYRTGQQFDASWDSSQAYPVQIGTGSVIPGWDQGLVGVTVGSRVQLDIPAALAYGDNPQEGQPAGPLRFVVDVLAIQ